MKTNELVGKHTFEIDEHMNGGESLTLETKVLSNGDPGGIFLNQELTLNSYCNSATFNLFGTVFTPDILRKLANELESVIINAKEKCK